MKHRRILLSLRILGWLVLGVLTLEICARTEDTVRYGAPFWGNYDNESLYTYDAQGKHGRPHASYLKWKLNEAGYRGPALRSGTYRIACIGSSETFGIYEAENNEWPRQLERELNQRAGRDAFEVVNTAYLGMTLSTSLRRLDFMMQAVHPRLILIYPSYANYISPDYSEAPPGVIPPPRPVQPRLVSRVREFLKNALPDDLQDRLRAYEVQRGSRRIEVLDRVPDQSVERFANDLDAIIRQIRSRGAEVVLITHATRFGSSVQPSERHLLTAWRKFYPRLREDGFLDMEKRMSDALRQTASRNSVLVIDAATQLKPGPQNFVEFVHFTDEGAHELAQLVAKDIQPVLRAEAGKESSSNAATPVASAK
jgi:hypothetical protein